MSHLEIKIESISSSSLEVIKQGAISAWYPSVWTIGNLEILNKKLLGFFCSVKCPGNIILKTYDLARALRDAGIAVVSGFHSPIEKDCLDLLLRGTQPIVICPARGIENMRVPKPWRNALEAGRLLIISTFEPKHKRLTAELAGQRNQFVATLADKIFVAHAGEGSRTDKFCSLIAEQDKPIYTFDAKENRYLSQSIAEKVSINSLVAILDAE